MSIGKELTTELKEIFESKFGSGIKRYELLSDGFLSNVYRVDLNSSSKFILKIYKRGEKSDKLAKKEVWLLNCLPKLNIPGPSLRSYNVSREPYFILIDFLSQKSLRESINQYSIEELCKLFNLFGFYLSNLHSIHFSKFGDIEIVNSKPRVTTYIDMGFTNRLLTTPLNVSAQQFYRGIVKKRISIIKDSIFNNYYQKLTNFFKMNLELLGSKDEYKPMLVHGDFQDKNIMTENKKLIGIIDYEFAYSGLSEVDLFVENICCYEDFSTHELKRIQKALFQGYGYSYRDVEITNKLKPFFIMFNLLDAMANYSKIQNKLENSKRKKLLKLIERNLENYIS